MHVNLFFVLFLSSLSFLYNDLCFDIFERERERDIFFKDMIIVVVISVHNRGRIEIEKSRKKRIYWSNTHQYRVQRYTLTGRPARLDPKLSIQNSRVTENTAAPDGSLLFLIGF